MTSTSHLRERWARLGLLLLLLLMTRPETSEPPRLVALWLQRRHPKCTSHPPEASASLRRGCAPERRRPRPRRRAEGTPTRRRRRSPEGRATRPHRRAEGALAPPDTCPRRHRREAATAAAHRRCLAKPTALRRERAESSAPRAGSRRPAERATRGRRRAPNLSCFAKGGGLAESARLTTAERRRGSRAQCCGAPKT